MPRSFSQARNYAATRIWLRAQAAALGVKSWWRGPSRDLRSAHGAERFSRRAARTVLNYKPNWKVRSAGELAAVLAANGGRVVAGERPIVYLCKSTFRYLTA